MKKKTNWKNNNLNQIQFGYKYDNENNKVVIDESQLNVIRSFIELRTTYLLEYSEIYYLCINEQTIEEIIVNRIEGIYDTLEDYDLELTNPFENVNVIKLLKQETEVKNKIIKPLVFTNKKISSKEKYEIISKKIERVIKLIELRNELIKKYDFKKIADTINEYNESLKSKPTGIKIKENDNPSSSNNYHKEIIDKETWEKAQTIYNKRQSLEEMNYEK